MIVLGMIHPHVVAPHAVQAGMILVLALVAQARGLALVQVIVALAGIVVLAQVIRAQALAGINRDCRRRIDPTWPSLLDLLCL